MAGNQGSPERGGARSGTITERELRSVDLKPDSSFYIFKSVHIKSSFLF